MNTYKLIIPVSFTEVDMIIESGLNLESAQAMAQRWNNVRSYYNPTNYIPVSIVDTETGQIVGEKE